jgi:DDE superfamily endonuclease
MNKISWISEDILDSKVSIATPNVLLEDIPSSKEGKSRSQCQWHSRVLLGSCLTYIHTTVKRPLVLICNGYGSHFNEEKVARAVQLKIILVRLPSNATHILQPLNVAVFKPFKTTLKCHFESFMIENAITTFLKKDIIQVASSAWLQGVMEKDQNIVHGFKTTGIWPLSFPNMQ